jgi:hypothetical protein
VPTTRARTAGLLLALAASAATARAEPPVDDGEWEREAPERVYVSPVGVEGLPTHVVLRIVDDGTGAGIPGATVALISQTEHPTTGLVAAERVGVADEEGWVRVRADDLGWGAAWPGVLWAYVEAPGRAGTAFEAHPSGEVRLRPAENVVVEVRDPLDRPVAGAVIGARISCTCGHYPDQRVATTAADGRAVLRDLGSGREPGLGWEGWVVHDALLSDYVDVLPRGRRPDAPVVLRHDGSRPLEGVVLDADGKPAVDLAVGTFGSHRGPWTRTDDLGRFRLVGADLERHRVSVVDERVRYRYGVDPPPPSFVAPPAGFRRVFRMPREGEAAPETHAVEVVLRDARTGEEVDDVVVAVRDEDGWTERLGDEAIERLPEGAYAVLGGGALSPWAPSRVRFEVRPGTANRLVVDLAPNPLVRFLFEDDPKAVGAWIVSATEERFLDEATLVAGVVPAASGEPCAFRLVRGERTTVVAVPAARGADAPPVRLHAPGPTVVRVALEGPDGQPVAGWVTHDLAAHLPHDHYADWDAKEPARTDPRTALHAEGTVDLLVVPEDRALAPRTWAVRIPPEARDGAEVDGGRVRLAPRGDRRLRMVLPDDSGGPWSVRVLRDGRWREGWADDDGVFDPPLMPLATGDVVEVDAEWVPGKVAARRVAKRLEGPGPWELRSDLPATSLLLRATEVDGAPLDALLVIDGRAYGPWADSEGSGPPEVVGLDPGPHLVAVAAANRATRQFRVLLKEGEHRTISASLRRTTPPGK